MKTNTTTKRKGFIAGLIALIAAAVLLIGATVTMSACTTSTAAFGLSKNDVFAFAGMTTGQLLGDLGGSAVGSSAAGGTQTAGTEADAQMTEVLDKYMHMADTLVSGGVTQVTEESDDPNYQYKMTVTVSDTLGAGGSYVMYYNEYFEGENVNPLPSDTAAASFENYRDRDRDRDDDDHDDDDHDDDEQERASVIEGKLVIGENEYVIEGKREIEEERGDSEAETELKAYINENTFVRFKQEIENNEQSFAYEIYEDGRKTDEFEIEIESESKTNKNGTVTMDVQKISLELIDEDGVPVEFELKYKNMVVNGENKVRIAVEYEKGGYEGEFDAVAYTAEDGTTAYRYYVTDVEIEIGHHGR